MKTVKKPYREVIVPRRPGNLDRAKVRQVWREILDERLRAGRERHKLARAA